MFPLLNHEADNRGRRDVGFDKSWFDLRKIVFENARMSEGDVDLPEFKWLAISDQRREDSIALVVLMLFMGN